MTKDEALKMAIEAIEFEGVRDSEDYWLMMDKVRTACKEALKQKEKNDDLYKLERLTMTKHKWHKEIKAWADGAGIEMRISDSNHAYVWNKCETPMWDTSEKWEYRIKPQPKETQYLYVIADNAGNLRITKDKDEVDNLNNSFDSAYIGKLQLEVDDD